MRITAQSPIVIKPQLADLLSSLQVGDVLRGRLIEMLGESISIKTAAGQVITAALTQSAELRLGQSVELSIHSINADGIFAQLNTDSQKPKVSDDTKLQQLLKQMDIKPEENNLQAAKLLLKYSMPITKENISNLVTTQKSLESLAQADAPKAIALLQSELNIASTEVTKLAKAAAKLESQSQQIITAVQGQALEQKDSKAVMKQLAAQIQAEAAKQDVLKQETPKLEKLMDTITKVFEIAAQAKPEQAAFMLSKDMEITPATVKAMVDNTKGENKLSGKLEGLEKLVRLLEENHVDVKEMRQELKKLFVKPEELQDKEQVTEKFKDIIKLSGKLEVLIKEQGLENKADISVLQDIKGNMDFMKSVNANINYLQIPIQINENNTTAELYVFNDKKKSKSINSENATILIALDLNKLGHIESLISVVKKNVDITFKVEKEEFKKVISNASDALKQALEARGYSLNPLRLIDIKEKFNLLELEELTAMDLGQLHLDVRV